MHARIAKFKSARYEEKSYQSGRDEVFMEIKRQIRDGHRSANVTLSATQKELDRLLLELRRKGYRVSLERSRVYVTVIVKW